jgi:hypothetical protein
MYPSQELYDEYYSPNDLPDEIDVDGVSYARAGTSYGDTTNGVLLEVNVWARYKNSVRLTQPCLIEKGVKDKFADTYTVTDANGSSVILRRVGECTWLSDLRESFCRTVEQGFWKESYEFPPWKVMYSLQGWRPFVPYNNGGEVAFWQLFKFNVVPYGNDFVVNPIIGYTPETQSPIYGDNADEIVGYETIPPQPIYGESGWTSIIWECNFAYQDNHIYKSSPGNSPVGEYHFVGSDGIRYLYNTIT